jgi:translocation and assembly module TamB
MPTPGPLQEAAQALRTGLRLLLPLASIMALLLVMLGAAGGALRWLLATEEGSHWLLQRLPMVEMKGFQGALLGESWRAERLRVSWDGGRQWLLLEGLAGDGLRWTWRPDDRAWVGLDAQQLTVQRATLHTGPATPGPVTLPARLDPPLRLHLAQAQVDELRIDDLEPLHGITLAGLVLDPSPGARHRVQRLGGQGFGVTLDGALSIANAAPLALDAQASLRPSGDGDNPRWAAVLRAGGSLAALELSGTLRGRAAPGHEAPMADLRAALRPLQAWPLAELHLQTQALDLAALTPRAPATRLAGQAELRGGNGGNGGNGGTPLSLTLQLDNAQPGRWDEHRLPLRRLALELHGQANRRDRVELSRFELTLADATRSAGRWSGSAVWQGPELTLDTRLDSVTPQRLDGRAAAMTLSGPVQATLRGLPSPDFSAPTAGPPAAPHIDWKLDLQGRLDAAPQPVQLALEGSADDQRLVLRRARAQSGSASAELEATLARAARGGWALTTTGNVLGFDPLPWWPGSVGSAWRKGPHRLSGDWHFELSLPRNAERLEPLALAQRLAGNGALRIHDSLLAGVPLAAEGTLGYTQAGGPSAGSLRAELRLGGNSLALEGQGDPLGEGEGDRWRAELKADSLATLAPLAALWPAAAAWTPRQGSASASVAAEGRWPALRSDGSARVTQLQAGTLALARGTAAWHLDSRGDRPMSVQLDLAGLAWGTQRADNLRADLRGTLADHHLDISGAMPLVPPPMAEQVLGIEVQSGTRAQMQASGAWTADAAGGGRWKARVENLVIGSWDGSAATGPPASGWAEAKDLSAELHFDATGKLLALRAAPGRVRLADAVALRWDEVNIDLAGSAPQIQLRADIEPFALAPLLARAQPGFGWQGDLRLGAHVEIHAAEKVEADLVFERRDGDLHVVNGEATQLLGLTELRLALSVHEGLWTFTPVFRGRSLGDIEGLVQVQTTPDRRWPQPDAPVEGSVRARVADIGIWSAWVPPGWRLAGELRTQATLGGRFGARTYTGEVTGSGLGVRNLLEGVNVSDGQILLKLDGETARIERFTLKGGEGSLSVSGSATLGGAPQARLQVKAERFRVLGRVDRQVIASGDAELLLQGEQTRVDGKFRIDEGLFDTTRGDAPRLDEDVTVRRPASAADTPASPGTPKAQRNFAMAVTIDMGQKLRVRGRGLDSELRGQLQLSTPGGRLAVNGAINTENGTYAAYGQKLDIERGIVAFSGAADNPRLDVLALRPNIDTRVGVLITGTLLSPRVRLYSEPDMSDTDKLSWLVLGRAPDGLGRSDTALLQRAALALLAGEGEAPTDALVKALGIDDLSLRQSDGEVRETVISLGKQLSRRWYLGYERGVNSTTGTWQLVYRIAQQFTLRLQSGLDNSADVIWTWRLQKPPSDASMRKSVVVPP